MKKSVFSRWFVVLLLFSAPVWRASVNIMGASAMGKDRSAPAGDLTDVDAIKQLERDIGNAMVASDIEKLNQIYANDWATVGYSGKVITKETLLSDFKSFHDKLEWFEHGPINVHLFSKLQGREVIFPLWSPTLCRGSLSAPVAPAADDRSLLPCCHSQEKSRL